MTLKEYLKGSWKETALLAARLECSVGYLYLVISGKRRCSKLMAKEIERRTKGAVKADELRAQKGPDNVLETV